MKNTENKTRTVFIPKKGRNDNERFISVNGDNILVRTGEVVEVPAKFAAVIENSLKMEQAPDDYIAENRRED
jgi:hypothetical protein